MTRRITLLLAILSTLGLASSLLTHSITGCSLNGTLYAEGSAMGASSICEYCYCIKGKQHCIRPHCLLNVPGCKPEYNEHSCCPVKYNCSDIRNTTSTSTTTAASLIQTSGSSCKINGSTYPEGERIEEIGDQCENCYCMKGKVRCEPIICSIPLEACSPVTAPGNCCPTSYNCSDTELTTTEYSVKDNDVTTENGITPGTTVFIVDKSETDSTTLDVTTEESTFESPTNDTELRSGTENGIVGEDNTTFHPVTLEATTFAAEPTNLPESNSSSPIRSIPDVLEAIINRTLAKDEDYEYDYNEPSLPPSLPNLKIIPFVAADAVVKEQDEYSSRLEGKTEIPIYLDIPQPNRFSPPSKTEGGFVPRDPVIDGPFYESKFEKPFTHNDAQIELTSETLLPPITEPPKLFEEGKCNSEGRTYHHGEVVSEPNACELCVCYYRQIHCQKPKCNPVKPGCHRVLDATSGCCGREICGPNADRPPHMANNIETTSLSNPLPESMSNIPAITVADLVVTPDPFKDVIRTEPAPDLEDIMKDMLPHIINESSVVKPTIPDSGTSLKTGNISNFSKTDNNISTNNKITPLLNEHINTNVSQTINKTDDYVKPPQNETVGKNSSKYQDDYDDSFSLSSVLDLLFRGESQESNSKRPVLASTTSGPNTHNNVYHIHTAEQKPDINNAIENVDLDDHVQKNNSPEKSNDLSIFSDYQADESKNDTKEESESFGSSEITKTETKPTNSSVDEASSDNKTVKEDIASGLLKLAGCNIYGRMYRVGRIISELSGPCLECMCTEFGVQCRKLC